MHIGLIIYGHLDIISGGYLYNRQLVDYWRKNGHRVTIFSLPWRNYWRHLGDNFAHRWLHQLIATDLDILVQDELNHPSLVGLNYFLRRRAPFPLVSLIHLLRSSEPHSRWTQGIYRQIERHYLRQMDGLIYNSRDTAQLSHALSGNHKPSVLAYPGRDHWSLALNQREIEQRAMATGPLRILFVGNYIERKGLHTLLAALAGLEAGSWQLTAVGRTDLEPSYVQRLRQTVARQGLAGQVHLLGERPFQDMPHIFRTHQLFAMPSYYEPFGIVYLEALGAGLPVIASTAVAGRELVTAGENGFLVAPEAVADLRACIASLQQDRPFLAAMGSKARQRYEQHPTWAETGATITTFLADLIS